MLEQPTLDRWLLKQDVIDQLVNVGEDSNEAEDFANRILSIANTEEADFIRFQTLLIGRLHLFFP